jgi:LCP family protein required for cell wall assembly
MPREEKPYRVYRGGRQKGKVPTAARRTRTTSRAREADGVSSYRGPGPRPTRKRWTWRRWLVVGLVALVVLFLVWAVASYLSLRNGVKDANKRLPAGSVEALTHQNSLMFSSPSNILLLGTDHANQPGHDTQHSDSIMILRTDPSRRRIVYLSIPRDLRVPVPGIGDTKVNAAMQNGGVPLAIRTLQAYTGLSINHVITVDFSQFKDVIDAVGGITVDVPEEILSKFDCPLKTDSECASWKGWHFVKGPQHMDGRRALIYSRVRKNSLNPADSDVSRTERQQQVLQATLRKMTGLSTLARLPFDGGSLVKPLATDLSTFQFMQLAWAYKRGHALHCRLGGTPETLPDGESVIVSEGDDKEYVIQTVLGKTAPLPPRPGEHTYGAGCVRGSFPS